MSEKSLMCFIFVQCLVPLLIWSVNAGPDIGKNDSKIRNAFYDDYIKHQKFPLVKKKLICEHFSSSCKESINEKCHENKTCSGEDDFCYTSWTLNENDSLELFQHPSGYGVKRMGCITTDQADHDCNENCEQITKLNQKHGHLYCCCTSKNRETIYFIFGIF